MARKKRSNTALSNDDAVLLFGIWWVWSRRASAVVLQPPIQFTPPEQPSPVQPPPEVIPVPPAPSVPPEESPTAHWSPDGKTLNSLTGFHRAKQREVTPQMLSDAQEVLNEHTWGEIVFGTDSGNGKRYAIAIEQHYHAPGGPVKPWGPHKGTSVFVQN